MTDEIDYSLGTIDGRTTVIASLFGQDWIFRYAYDTATEASAVVANLKDGHEGDANQFLAINFFRWPCEATLSKRQYNQKAWHVVQKSSSHRTFDSVKCYVCGRTTANTGTCICDRCWEMKSRITGTFEDRARAFRLLCESDDRIMELAQAVADIPIDEFMNGTKLLSERPDDFPVAAWGDRKLTVGNVKMMRLLMQGSDTWEK